MSKIILSPDHFYNCPICGKPCMEDQVSGWQTPIHALSTCQVFYCYNPLATDPLHYYNHIVSKEEPNQLAYHEFSLDLGNRSVIFGTNFLQQKSLIKTDKRGQPLTLDFVLVPDFPHLSYLKKKIKTALTFA